MKKTIKNISLASLSALLAYSATCGLLFMKQRKLLYRAPRRTLSPDNIKEVIASDGALPALSGWVDNEGMDKAVIYYGGSSESVELRRFALSLAFPNHTRYLVPYRGFGPNSHLLSEEMSIKSDSIRLFDHAISKHKVVDILGRSLGTGVAIHVAAQREPRRVVLITPYDSIIEVAKKRYKYFPIGYMLKDKFESWKEADKISSPIHVVLADSDIVTPHECWESLKKHINMNSNLIVTKVPNTDHSNIVDSMKTWEHILESGKF